MYSSHCTMKCGWVHHNIDQDKNLIAKNTCKIHHDTYEVINKDEGCTYHVHCRKTL